MISEDTKERILREHFAKLGKRGGRKITPAKTKASRRNVKAAQAAVRKYPRCPKYGSHHFSKAGKCYGCDFIKPE